MADKKAKGLGRGLDALFADQPEAKEVHVLSLQSLEPSTQQPRKDFDEEAMAELTESIRENGIIQPITVRELPSGTYEIIAGERRWRAARRAGLKEVPVYVVQADDQQAARLTLIENLQREDLNPLEEAEGYQQLMERYSLSQEETAASVGKSRPAIANSLRLLKLPEGVQAMLREGKLSAGHARALLSLPTQKQILSAAETTVENDLSVRQTEQLVKRLLKPPAKEPVSHILAVDYIRECESDLTRKLGRKVTIHTGRKKGRVEIEYYGDDDLQRCLEILGGLNREEKEEE